MEGILSPYYGATRVTGGSIIEITIEGRHNRGAYDQGLGASGSLPQSNNYQMLYS